MGPSHGHSDAPITSRTVALGFGIRRCRGKQQIPAPARPANCWLPLNRLLFLQASRFAGTIYCGHNLWRAQPMAGMTFRSHNLLQAQPFTGVILCLRAGPGRIAGVLSRRATSISVDKAGTSCRCSQREIAAPCRCGAVSNRHVGTAITVRPSGRLPLPRRARPCDPVLRRDLPRHRSTTACPPIPARRSFARIPNRHAPQAPRAGPVRSGR